MNYDKANLEAMVRQLEDGRYVLRSKKQRISFQETELKMRVGFIVKEVKRAATTKKYKVVDLIGNLSQGLGTVSDPFEKLLSDLADDSSCDDQTRHGPSGGSGTS